MTKRKSKLVSVWFVSCWIYATKTFHIGSGSISDGSVVLWRRQKNVL